MKKERLINLLEIFIKDCEEAIEQDRKHGLQKLEFRDEGQRDAYTYILKLIKEIEA